jgi:uncharacterized HNH endonuclease L247
VDEFIKIPNTENYYIDLKYRQIYRFENGCYCPMDNSLPLVVVINNQTLTKDINWYYWYTVYDLDFPEGISIDLNKLRFEQIHVNKFSTNVYSFVPVYETRITKTVDGIVYAVLPEYANYGVSADGELYSFKANEIVRKTLGKIGEYYKAPVSYIIYNFKSQKYSNITKLMPIHRLVARAWVENDDPLVKVFIDHINSNKLDNRAENLKWVSPQANVVKEMYGTYQHAFVLRNVDTGEISSHSSLLDCSKYIGRSRIRPKLTLFDSGRIFVGKHGRFELRRNNESVNWYYKKLLNGVTPNIYIKYPNGDIDYVSNVKEVIRAVNGVTWSCNFKDVKEDAAKLGVETDYIIPIFARDKIFQVYNIETKETLEFDSIKKLIRAVPVAEATVYKYLKNNWNNVPLNGYLYRVKDDAEWPTEIKDKNTDYGRCGIKVTNETNGEVKTYKSIKEAAEAYNLSDSHISKLARFNAIFSRDGMALRVSRIQSAC